MLAISTKSICPVYRLYGCDNDAPAGDCIGLNWAFSSRFNLNLVRSTQSIDQIQANANWYALTLMLRGRMHMKLLSVLVGLDREVMNSY